jgi:hypothetical protein
MTPAAVRLDEQSNPFRFHAHTLAEIERYIKWGLVIGDRLLAIGVGHWRSAIGDKGRLLAIRGW